MLQISYPWSTLEDFLFFLKGLSCFIKNYYEYLKETLLQELHHFSLISPVKKKMHFYDSKSSHKIKVPKIDLVVPTIRQIDIMLF